MTENRRIYDAVIVLAASTGITFFWLLSQQAVSQTAATVMIPLCFMTVVVTIVIAVLRGGRT